MPFFCAVTFCVDLLVDHEQGILGLRLCAWSERSINT